ncbi:cardiomyopathy-associated protein 5-like isoform X1 [Polyodon spathula]|uniref:cardiomyopathy-associated protein 5-like isoform X1 n=2 Tax=Polyodon spathula TaxID=7913 RepID=UPI001B7E53E7|nr:cardiomyopathy-associated protein 5-like isoform X1 [Polyodon spathula]
MEACLPEDIIEPEIAFTIDNASNEVGAVENEEAEELGNSLKDLVQDQSIKPKLQCLMLDPTFSMVTVQSEDSGIVWETSSSRCSTPWASEASSTSDVFSLEGSPAGYTPGKVVFIMDQDKIIRRRKRSSLGSRMSETNGKTRDNSKQFPRKPTATVPIMEVSLQKAGTNELLPHAPVTSRPANNGNPHPSPLKRTQIHPEELSPVSARSGGQGNPLHRQSETLTDEPLPHAPVTSRPISQGNPHQNSLRETDVVAEEPVQHTPVSSKGNPQPRSLREREEILPHMPVTAKPGLKDNPHPNPLGADNDEPSAHTAVSAKPVVKGNPHPHPFQEKETETQELLPHGPVAAKPVEKVNPPKREKPCGMVQGTLLKCDAPPPEHKIPTFSLQKDPVKEKLESKEDQTRVADINPTLPLRSSVSDNPKPDSALSNPVPVTSSAADPTEPSQQNPCFLPNMSQNPVVTESIPLLQSTGTAFMGAEYSFPNPGKNTLPNFIAATSSQEPETDKQTAEHKAEPDSQKEVFNIVSEGYEILNIIAPPEMLSVDEMECSHMQDNLAYLEDNPLIKPKVLQEAVEADEIRVIEEEMETESSDISEEKSEKKRELKDTIISEQKETDNVEQMGTQHFEQNITTSTELTQPSVLAPLSINGNNDVDYFEKFTLMDEQVPGEKPMVEKTEKEDTLVNEDEENMEEKSKSVSFSEDCDVFVFVDDIEIAGEHLDEVFYGTEQTEVEACTSTKHYIEDETHDRKDGHLKESGASLFSHEEETLTKCYYPVTTKIIDLSLLEEPPAMAFLYTDLYDQATGRKEKDDEPSDEESLNSDASFPSRLSDSDDNTGIYFEKYNLKDDVPLLEGEPTPQEEKKNPQSIWYQNTFELTGSFTQKEEADINSEEASPEACSNISDLSPYEEAKQLIDVYEESDDLVFEAVVSKDDTISAGEVETLDEKNLEVAEEEPQTQQSVKEKPAEKEKEGSVVVTRDTLSSPESGKRPFEVLSGAALNVPVEVLKLDQSEVEAPSEPNKALAGEMEAQDLEIEDEPLIKYEVSADSAEDIYTAVPELKPEEEISVSEPIHLEEANKSEPYTAETTSETVHLSVQDTQDKAVKIPKDEPQLIKTEQLEAEASLIEDDRQKKEGAVDPVVVITEQKISVEHRDTCNVDETADKTHDTDVEKPEELQNPQEWHSADLSTAGSDIVVKSKEQELRSSEETQTNVIQETVEETVLDKQDDQHPSVEHIAEPDVEQHDPESYEEGLHLGLENVPSQSEVCFEQCIERDEETAEDLDYEMVTQQDIQDDYTTSEMELLGEREYIIEGTEEHHENEFDLVDDVAEDVSAEEVIGADFEIIEALGGTSIIPDAELALKEPKKPLLDTFCLVCKCPISAIDKLFGEHQDHDVSTLDKAVVATKNKLIEYISELQGRAEKIEDLVAELELAFNTVEENCSRTEQLLDDQNEEMVKTVVEQYSQMSQNLEEEKKNKLEQLYDQLVTFQESTESAKEILEKSVKEVEEPDDLIFISSSNDISKRLNNALETTVALELAPSAFPVFEDYAKSTSGNGQKLLKSIAVPQTPKLQPQEASSATSSSVMVYWKVNEGDVIDCFQVYCMEEPQGAMSEEYRVTVKESYCTLEDLEPDKCYLVWVMSVNYTGCSLPSEKTSFRTAPSGPVIKPEECTVCWDTATIRWSSANLDAVECFTLEYCKQYACEGEGLRSISGIRNCEQKVLLQPSENYLFYIKAVNFAGASEQSEAALISTKGTRFHLLKETANSALVLSEDGTAIHYEEQTFKHRAKLNDSLGVLGELLPPRGYHYWETAVGGSEAYRIGVVYPSTPRDSPLGQNGTSWCIRCHSSPTRFEFLHSSAQADIQVAELPQRIGTLLDYLHGRLLFFNAQSGQLLFSYRHTFTEACHPALAVDRPGSLTLHTGIQTPDFVKHS